jgi:hypothetical protein
MMKPPHQVAKEHDRRRPDKAESCEIERNLRRQSTGRTADHAVGNFRQSGADCRGSGTIFSVVEIAHVGMGRAVRFRLDGRVVGLRLLRHRESIM